MAAIDHLNRSSLSRCNNGRPVSLLAAMRCESRLFFRSSSPDRESKRDQKDDPSHSLWGTMDEGSVEEGVMDGRRKRCGMKEDRASVLFKCCARNSPPTDSRSPVLFVDKVRVRSRDTAIHVRNPD